MACAAEWPDRPTWPAPRPRRSPDRPASIECVQFRDASILQSPGRNAKGWRASPRRCFHYKSPSCLEAQARVRPRSTLGLRSDIESNVGPALRITPHGGAQKQRRPCDGVSCGLATCFLVRKFDVRYFLLNLLDYV